MTARQSKRSLAIAASTNQVAAAPATSDVSENDKLESPERHPIDEILVNFLLDLRSILKTHQLVIPHVFVWLQKTHKSNAATLAKYASKENDKANVYKADSAHQAAEMFEAIRAIDGLGGMRIPNTLQRSLFTQMFSEFDAFAGALLKIIYKSKADLLKGISRQITLVDLLKYEDLNAVKLDMLEKEVDSFRRDSYVEQFISLENKFGLQLRAFPEWGEFVEFSQRRNLIVHNGGIVNEQYLSMCDREGYLFATRPATGDQLMIDGIYFGRANLVVSKVAFMLCHTLWRKIFPDQKKASQEAANSVLYELLKDKRWRTANEIALFCLTSPMRTELEDIALRMRTINAAIAAKFSGNQKQCLAHIQSLDWSASYRDFRLAILVLQDNFIKAAEMMKAIGPNGELVNELSYHEWPLFFKFRDSPEFMQAYSDIYKSSFLREAVRHSAEAVQVSEAELLKGREIFDVQATEVKPGPTRSRSSKDSVAATNVAKPPAKPKKKPVSAKNPLAIKKDR